MQTDDSGASRQRIMLVVAIVLIIVAVGLAWARLGGASAASIAAERAFRCIECDYDFEYTIKRGDMEPFECPKCGKMAGYRAEACYWTKDENDEWKAKLEPTFVVLKTRVDPTSTEKTFCPDCGHPVKGHNPRPPKELMDAARAEAGE